MAKLSRRSISRRTVEALTVEKDTVFWDRDLPGFGVRVGLPPISGPALKLEFGAG